MSVLILKNKSKNELGKKSNPYFIHYIYVGEIVKLFVNYPQHKIF